MPLNSSTPFNAFQRCLAVAPAPPLLTQGDGVMVEKAQNTLKDAEDQPLA
jgi:hypothetical protein